MYYQEYIIKREGEYPIPVYHSVVALTQGHDLYSHMWHFSLQGVLTSTMALPTWCLLCGLGSHMAVSMCTLCIKVMSLSKGYYTVVYWSRILSLSLYYTLAEGQIMKVS